MNTSRVGSLATGPFDITSCRARMLEAGLPLILSVTDCEWYCGKVMYSFLFDRDMYLTIPIRVMVVTMRMMLSMQSPLG